MRGSVRTTALVGWYLVSATAVYLLFGMTPERYLAAIVACVGAALLIGALWDAWDRRKAP